MYFECIVGNGGGGTSGIPLIVTCDSQFAGSTITATKSGAATQTATCPSSSPYTVEFELPEDGTWTVSGTVSGQTFSEVVTITAYTATLNAIPEGATVTPTDDIQTWLHCAGIFDKAYTTISQVLNDGTTVTALIASSNAVDYMARSTTWASSVTANSSVMTKIGANDYCANKLLANSTWLNAICNSTYFESVLTTKVPTMTSTTTPSGNVIVSGALDSSHAGWKAFDGNSTTYWQAASDSTGPTTSNPQWIGYVFSNQVSIKKFMFESFGVNYSPKTFKLQGRNSDSDTWQDIQTYSGSTATQTLIVDNSNNYIQFRLYCTASGGNNTLGLNTMQFYGRASS